ncbi:MAG: SxtJ family membrane protein [Burkholderiales bacterium]
MEHEDLSRRQPIQGSSDRSFGLVFAVVFLVIFAWPLVHREAPRWWSLAAAAVFGLLAAFKPDALTVLNKWWTKFGELLGKIVSPIALGILFYGVLTPIGLLARLAGKDFLNLKGDAKASSYWIKREPPGPPPGSMDRQF